MDVYIFQVNICEMRTVGKSPGYFKIFFYTVSLTSQIMLIVDLCAACFCVAWALT
jgi:hypothetical protein